MAQDKIKEINRHIEDKRIVIMKKQKEINELNEEVATVEEDIETVIVEKNKKLELTIEDLRSLPTQHYASIANSQQLDENDFELLDVLHDVIMKTED
jgi:uncharacterized coiled-coil protein SlyX